MSDVLTLHACASLVKSNVKPEVGGQRKYIGLEHIEQGTLRLSGTGLESDVASTKAAFNKGDVLFGKLRPYFRKVVYAPFEGVCSTDIWVLRAKPGIDQRFLYYWVASQEFVDYAVQGSDGTRMPRASWSQASQHSIPFQTEHEQKAIAHILGTLDDKIDQLRKTNSVLEDMASALFKSWFVDFDPVKAKQENRPTGLPKELDDLFPDTFEDSALGPIPTGWRVGCVGDVCDFVYGKPLVAGNRKPGPIGVYGSNGLIGWHNESIVPGPVIVVGRKGNPGVITWVNDDCYPIDTAFYLEPSKESVDIRFLYLLLKTLNLRDLSAESAVPGLNRNHAYMVKVVLPPRTVISTFEHFAESSMNKVHVNAIQIRTLTNLRDTLLPKLISGDLRVPEAEQMVAELGL